MEYSCGTDHGRHVPIGSPAADVLSAAYRMGGTAAVDVD